MIDIVQYFVLPRVIICTIFSINYLMCGILLVVILFHAGVGFIYVLWFAFSPLWKLRNRHEFYVTLIWTGIKLSMFITFRRYSNISHIAAISPWEGASYPTVPVKNASQLNFLITEKLESGRWWFLFSMYFTRNFRLWLASSICIDVNC